MLSDNIKRYREQAGLSHDTVARLLGVSAKTVKSWESGKQIPSQTEIAYLATALNIDQATLRGENNVEKMMPDPPSGIPDTDNAPKSEPTGESKREPQPKPQNNTYESSYRATDKFPDWMNIRPQKGERLLWTGHPCPNHIELTRIRTLYILGVLIGFFGFLPFGNLWYIGVICSFVLLYRLLDFIGVERKIKYALTTHRMVIAYGKKRCVYKPKDFKYYKMSQSRERYDDGSRTIVFASTSGAIATTPIQRLQPTHIVLAMHYLCEDDVRKVTEIVGTLCADLKEEN